MATEILAIDSQGPLTPYQGLLHQQIQDRGDDNHPIGDTRFNRDAAPSRDYDYSYDSRTGEVFFGEAWETHHLEVKEFQVVYALKSPTVLKADEWLKLVMQSMPGEEVPDEVTSEPTPIRAELYVYEFGDAGTLSRTQFAEEDDGAIHKTRVGALAEAEGFGIVDVRGELGPRKRATLETVIADPEAGVVALRSLIKLTQAEERQANRAQREHIARAQAHADAMEAIDRAHRVPMFPHTKAA